MRELSQTRSRAVTWLAERAEDRVRRVDEWDVAQDAAYEALSTTPTAEGRSAVRRVLEAQQADGRNWQLLLRAAVAAGRIRATEAAPGVKRMLERIQDNDAWKAWREPLAKALGVLEGA
jgi:hypothetical protein